MDSTLRRTLSPAEPRKKQEGVRVCDALQFIGKRLMHRFDSAGELPASQPVTMRALRLLFPGSNIKLSCISFAQLINTETQTSSPRAPSSSSLSTTCAFPSFLLACWKTWLGKPGCFKGRKYWEALRVSLLGSATASAALVELETVHAAPEDDLLLI